MGSLGNKIKTTIFNAVRDILEQLIGTIAFVLSASFETILTTISKPVKSITLAVVNKFMNIPDIPDELKDFKQLIQDSNGVEAVFLCVLMGLTLPAAILQGIVAPYTNRLQRSALMRLPSVLAPVDAQIVAYLRNQINSETLRSRLLQLGFDEDQQATLLKIAEQRPTASDYSQYWLRGMMETPEYEVALRELGYNAFDRELYKELAHYIPNAPDLIRMAVREVFTPDIAKKFGQFENFPEEFATWGAKQGLSREWCMNYWAAHWELPSPQMGFEMLHRRIIDDDTLDMLLRALDVMPFWRDKIKAITYNPYTRVDVRRMFGVGVLTEDEVYSNYLDLGYDPLHASKLTEFTTKSVKSENKDLAKGEILTGYRERVLTAKETGYSLAALGYSQDEIEYLLAIEDSKFAEAEQKEHIALLQTKLAAKQLNMTDFQAELGKLNLPATQMELLIAKAELKSTVKATLPTKDEAIKWYNAGKINSDEANDILDALGYDTKYVDLYLSDVTKAPSASIVIRWYNKGLIDIEQTDKYLQELKYGKTERQMLILEAATKEPVLVKLPSLETVKHWYSTGRTPESDARLYLMQMGYGDKEINIFISEWTPEGV